MSKYLFEIILSYVCTSKKIKNPSSSLKFMLICRAGKKIVVWNYAWLDWVWWAWRGFPYFKLDSWRRSEQLRTRFASATLKSLECLAGKCPSARQTTCEWSLRLTHHKMCTSFALLRASAWRCATKKGAHSYPTLHRTSFRFHLKTANFGNKTWEKIAAFILTNSYLPILDLSSVSDHEVDAKGLNSHTAIHHGGEQEGPLFIDCIPVFANEIKDFSRFVAVRRHGLWNVFLTPSEKKRTVCLLFFRKHSRCKRKKRSIRSSWETRFFSTPFKIKKKFQKPPVPPTSKSFCSKKNVGLLELVAVPTRSEKRRRTQRISGRPWLCSLRYRYGPNPSGFIRVWISISPSATHWNPASSEIFPTQRPNAYSALSKTSAHLVNKNNEQPFFCVESKSLKSSKRQLFSVVVIRIRTICGGFTSELSRWSRLTMLCGTFSRQVQTSKLRRHATKILKN